MTTDPNHVFLHRRHRLRLDLEADTLDGLWDELLRIAEKLDNEQRTEADITTGAPDTGYHLTLTTDPDMTPDRYAEYLRDKPWEQK